MNIRLVWASVAGVLALAAPAFAHTVNCSEDSDRLQDNLSRLERSSTLTIKGNCVGNVTVATDGVSLVAHPNGGSITGQVEVTAQRVSITGISILGPEPSDPETIVRAGLFARDGASVSFANGTIANHTKVGVIAVRNASVIVTASVITGNGTANGANSADGVQAADGGTVMLGTPDANNDPVPSAAAPLASWPPTCTTTARRQPLHRSTARCASPAARSARRRPSTSSSPRLAGRSTSRTTPAIRSATQR